MHLGGHRIAYPGRRKNGPVPAAVGGTDRSLPRPEGAEGRVALGDYSPRAPTDPDVRTLAHPVPQPTDLLSTSMGSPLLFDRLTLTCLMNLNVFSMFPSTESAGRRFAFLHWVLQGEFPSFSGTIKALRLPATHLAALRFLRLAIPQLHSLCSLPDGRVSRQGLELLTRCLRPGSCRGSNRISQVPVHNASFVTKGKGHTHALIAGVVLANSQLSG